MSASQCKARRDHAGDYVCDRCGTYWDADDDKPPCLPQDERKASPQTGKAAIKQIKAGLAKHD